MLYSKFKKIYKNIDLDEVLKDNNIKKYRKSNRIYLIDNDTYIKKVYDMAMYHVKPFLEVNNKYYIICPFCGEIHIHGAVDGYRIAHCKYISEHKEYFITK